MSPIKNLTPEQESLISVYCNKWRQTVLSTERIDCDRATTTIRKAYAISELNEPEIIFCDSPLVAIRELRGRSLKNRRRQLHTYLLQQIYDHFSHRLGQQCTEELHQYISNQVTHQTNTKGLSELFSLLNQKFIGKLEVEFKYSGISVEYLLKNSIQPNSWIHFICWFDYCISVLALVQPQSRWKSRWQTLQDLFTTCGWIFAYDGICFVCERPIYLDLDELGNLHAEGKAAIAFADGFKSYAHHGNLIPEEYGLARFEQWQQLLQQDLGRSIWYLRLSLLPEANLQFIKELSPEQEALIPSYHDKWREQRLSSRTTNRQRAAEAIDSVYKQLKLPKPEIVFFNNPELVIKYIKNHPEQKQHPSVPKDRLTYSKWHDLFRLLELQLEAQLTSNLIGELRRKLLYKNRWRGSDIEGFDLGRPFGVKLGRYFAISPPFWWRLWGDGNDLAVCQPDAWAANGVLFDFCFTVLGCVHNHQAWQAFQAIAQECGVLFPYEERCIVSDRPIKILLDAKGRLHAEGEPALVFADGTCVYVQHGIRLERS